MSRPLATPIAALLGAVLFLQGCAVLSPPPPRHGGSTLSEAAREATKDEDEKHKRLTSGEVEPGPETEVVIVTSGPCDPCDHDAGYRHERPEGPRRPIRWHVGLVSGAGMIEGKDFEPYRLGGIQIGTRPSPRTRVDLTLLGIPARFSASSGLRAPFATPFELAADVSGRFQLVPEHMSFGLYPIAGFRVGTLLWDYRNPILIDDRMVANDWINYCAPYAGVGVSFLRTRRMEIGAHVTGGVRFWDRHTQEGLQNDRFSNEPFSQVTVETTVRF